MDGNAGYTFNRLHSADNIYGNSNVTKNVNVYIQSEHELREQLRDLHRELKAKDAEIAQLSKMLDYANSQVRITKKVKCNVDEDIANKIFSYVKEVLFKRRKFVFSEEFMNLEKRRDKETNLFPLGREILDHLAMDPMLGVPSVTGASLLQWWYPYR